MKKFRFTALAVVGCFVFFLFGRIFLHRTNFIVANLIVTNLMVYLSAWAKKRG